MKFKGSYKDEDMKFIYQQMRKTAMPYNLFQYNVGEKNVTYSIAFDASELNILDLLIIPIFFNRGSGEVNPQLYGLM